MIKALSAVISLLALCLLWLAFKPDNSSENPKSLTNDFNQTMTKGTVSPEKEKPIIDEFCDIMMKTKWWNSVAQKGGSSGLTNEKALKIWKAGVTQTAPKEEFGNDAEYALSGVTLLWWTRYEATFCYLKWLKDSEESKILADRIFTLGLKSNQSSSVFYCYKILSAYGYHRAFELIPIYRSLVDRGRQANGLPLEKYISPMKEFTTADFPLWKEIQEIQSGQGSH